jgi:pimeloyl-ACP methyl ester carboxylesterase
MPVPEAQRGAMLGSYMSREGVQQALMVLAGPALSDVACERVIEDTLRGAPEAKREWTERGMIEDVSAGLEAVTVPTIVVIGDRDQVEHESALRQAFGRFLPQAIFRVLAGVGHLSPLERPGELAAPCLDLLATLSARKGQ